MGIVVCLQFKECTKWLCKPPPPPVTSLWFCMKAPFSIQHYRCCCTLYITYESGDQTVRYNSCWWCCRICWNTRRRWGFYKSRPWTACRRNYKWTTAILWGSWWSPSVPKWVGGESVHYTHRQYTDRQTGHHLYQNGWVGVIHYTHRQYTDRQTGHHLYQKGWVGVIHYTHRQYTDRQAGHHLYQKGWVENLYTTHIDNNTQTCYHLYQNGWVGSQYTHRQYKDRHRQMDIQTDIQKSVLKWVGGVKILDKHTIHHWVLSPYKALYTHKVVSY